jgi:alkylhydroperoxidase family enzyme
VSGLKACGYCYGVHERTAQSFGVATETLAGLLDDIDTAPVQERIRVLLRYVMKVTTTPSLVTPLDARAVLEDGWTERALHDAVEVCSLFNLMNRFVNGLGVTADQDYFDLSGHRLADDGYAGLKE